MGGDTRSDALYLDFLESYRAFCRHTGHKLPAAVADSLITWWGPMRLDLRALFDILQQHGSLDAHTGLQTWQQVSRSISCSHSCTSIPYQQQQQFLPVETVRQLFCTHLAGFRDYQQVQQLGCHRSCRVTDQCPQRQQHQKSRQQPQQTKQQQKKQRKQQHLQGLGFAQAKLKATRGNCNAGAANCSSRGSASTVSAAAGRAFSRRSAGSSSSSSSSGAMDTPGRKVIAASATGVRRTGRARVQAVRTGYVMSDVISDDVCATSSSDSEDIDCDASADSEAEYAELHPVLLGPAYQAELPQLRPRPASPTAAEAKLLTRSLYTPAAGQQQGQQQQRQQAHPVLALPPGQFHAQWVAASSGAARLQLLQQWLQRMDDAMGHGMAERLGLGLLGFKLQAAWSPQEELLFALGMLDKYRLFRHMHRRYLPKRSVHQLNGYYYSVWKTRSGQVAEEYALLCEQNGDVVKFRQSLCVRLAAIWDADSMGPIPPAAALPPAFAAKLVAKARAAPKAAAATTAAAYADVAVAAPTLRHSQAAAAAPSSAAHNSASAPSRLGGSQVPAAAPAAADSSSPFRKQHGLQRLTPAAGCTDMAVGAGVRSDVALHMVLTLNGRTSSNANWPLISQPLDGSSSPYFSPDAAEQRRSIAGCGSKSSWPCISLLDSGSADDGGGAAEAAAAAAGAHNRSGPV